MANRRHQTATPCRGAGREGNEAAGGCEGVLGAGCESALGAKIGLAGVSG